VATTWRESLLPASFRGIRFVIESSSVPVGRKGQLHEYPQRDEPFFEVLGKQAQVHKLTAFVIGDDCFERRDQLLEALEKEGAGELVHPWLGRMQVEAGECELQHDRREGGMARFDLTFYPEKPRQFPTAKANTQRQINQASTGVLDSSLGRYKSAIAKIDAARINIGALRNNLAGVYGVIQSQFSPFTSIYSNVTGFVQSLVSSPSAISSMISSFFAGFDAPGGGSSRSGSTSNSVADTSYRSSIATATQQAQAVSSINTVSQTSGRDTGQAAQATADLVQDALLVKVALVVADMPVASGIQPTTSTPALDQQMIQPVERPEVPVANDVVELRDTLSTAIWEASLKADPDHYQKLNALRVALVSHLNAVAASGVRLVDIKPSESLPALVLAYRRFGDATRSGEVVQRNRITHPGFVPPVNLKVAQE
jgi:prophage DNA circulation protein